MTYQDLELWVRPNTYEGNDVPTGPTPETAGLRDDMLYRVIDISHDNDHESETFLILINEDGEIWSVSNRHLRVEDVTNREGTSRRVFRYMELSDYDY